MDDDNADVMITEEQRSKLRCSLVENLQLLLFHREGYESMEVAAEMAAHLAATIEAKAYLFAVRASQLQVGSSFLKQYAREASTLLLSEVERLSQPAPSTSTSSGGDSGSGSSSAGGASSPHSHQQQQQGLPPDPQQLSLTDIAGGLRSIATVPVAAAGAEGGSSRLRDAPWGWLVPGSRALPYVVLKGSGVAIGRGKEALWAVANSSTIPHSTTTSTSTAAPQGPAAAAGGGGNSTSSSSPRAAPPVPTPTFSTSPLSLLAMGSDRRLSEALSRNLGFVEVADGRVSRLHCIIRRAWSEGAGEGAPEVLVEDCSSNGTFHNGRRMGRGETAPLQDGDRISLVKSVAPLVEQFFEFRSGDPSCPDGAGTAGSDEEGGGSSWAGAGGGSAPGVYSPGGLSVTSPPLPGTASASASAIFRAATSRYTTAEASTLEDLRCQICLRPLHRCVALEPCGHNFCATCLSHYLGAQLQGGLALSCPFRCPPPERVVINYAVRALIELLSTSSNNGGGGGNNLSSGSGAAQPPGGSSRVGLPPSRLSGAGAGAAGSSSGDAAAAAAAGGGTSSTGRPLLPPSTAFAAAAAEAASTSSRSSSPGSSGGREAAATAAVEAAIVGAAAAAAGGAAGGSGRRVPAPPAVAGGRHGSSPLHAALLPAASVSRTASGSTPAAAAAGGGGEAAGAAGAPSNGSGSAVDASLGGAVDRSGSGGSGSPQQQQQTQQQQQQRPASRQGSGLTSASSGGVVRGLMRVASPLPGAGWGEGGPGVGAGGEGGGGDYYTQGMSLLCPLEDDVLPLEAANLKTKQVEVTLAQLKDAEAGAERHGGALEALARLAWSDDGVRDSVAAAGGVKALVAVMQQHGDHDGVQCNGCLALMSLVRGEGEVCQANQWHIAKAGGVEVMVEAMRRFRGSAMVQLSVLLCCIPLCLENAMMQAHITREALGDIMAALEAHPEEVDIQTKGLVLLGVLIQGEDAVHDAIRQRLLEVDVPRAVKAALLRYGASNDDVLWAALFALAILVRESSSLYGRATHAIAAAHLVSVLRDTVHSYKDRQLGAAREADEMILSASEYLVNTLSPIETKLRQRQLVLLAAMLVVGAGAVWCVRRLAAGGGGTGVTGDTAGGTPH